MKVNEMNKLRYEAPETKTTGFRAEQGYAVSEPGTSTSAKITMTGSSL